MGKRMGSERLGSFYTGKRAKKRREWRGVKDTLYDYSQWLRIWGVLLGFASKPNNVKAFSDIVGCSILWWFRTFLTGIQKGCVILSFGLRIQL